MDEGGIIFERIILRYGLSAIGIIIHNEIDKLRIIQFVNFKRPLLKEGPFDYGKVAIGVQVGRLDDVGLSVHTHAQTAPEAGA